MKRLILATAAMLVPQLALAHPGHVDGASPFLIGLAHPVGGADHLLAMVAIGLLAAQRGGRAARALPLTFVGAMLGGAVMGMNGMGVAATEPMILASVAILGVLIAMAVRMPLVPILTMVALFGLAHGGAHGAEGPATGAIGYAAGFTGATLALIGLGMGLGHLLTRGTRLRMLGGCTTLAGLALAFGG